MTAQRTQLNGITALNHAQSTEFGIPYDEPSAFLRRGFVTVFHPSESLWGDGKIKPATINWSAIVSQDPETAELFVEAMNQAIQLAKELNSKLGEN